MTWICLSVPSYSCCCITLYFRWFEATWSEYIYFCTATAIGVLIESPWMWPWLTDRWLMSISLVSGELVSYSQPIKAEKEWQKRNLCRLGYAALRHGTAQNEGTVALWRNKEISLLAALIWVNHRAPERKDRFNRIITRSNDPFVESILCTLTRWRPYMWRPQVEKETAYAQASSLCRL